MRPILLQWSEGKLPRTVFFFEAVNVYINIFWLKCSIDLIFLRAQSPGLKKCFTYPYWWYWVPRKIFRDTSIENFISKPSFFAYFSAFSNFKIGLPKGMKTHKSLSLHVWWLRMRSKHGMVTKLFSAQRYDPRQVSESLVWCAEPHKKFSRLIQSQTVGCVKHNFWNNSETFLQNRVAKGYEISKFAMFARLVA